MTTQALHSTIADGVADVEAGRWSPVSVPELLGDPVHDLLPRQAVARRRPLLATATWRRGWATVPEEHRVRVLSVLVLASRHLVHPCLAATPTAFPGVHTVRVGRGITAALRPMPDGSYLWVALLV